MKEINARLANPPKELISKYTEKEYLLYTEYAKHVQEILEEESINNTINKMLQEENIDVTGIDTRIMLFPQVIGETTLVGTCDIEKRQISIYPMLQRDLLRTIESIKEIAKPENREFALESYIVEHLLASVLEEFLHLKYKEDHKIIKKKVMDYMEQDEWDVWKKLIAEEQEKAYKNGDPFSSTGKRR